MIICGVDLKYVNNNQWVDDDADDDGGGDPAEAPRGFGAYLRYMGTSRL